MVKVVTDILTFYSTLIISNIKNSLFTEYIYNFALNAKTLHHEQGKHKHIESI